MHVQCFDINLNVLKSEGLIFLNVKKSEDDLSEDLKCMVNVLTSTCMS